MLTLHINTVIYNKINSIHVSTDMIIKTNTIKYSKTFFAIYTEEFWLLIEHYPLDLNNEKYKWKYNCKMQSYNNVWKPDQSTHASVYIIAVLKTRFKTLKVVAGSASDMHDKYYFKYSVTIILVRLAVLMFVMH